MTTGWFKSVACGTIFLGAGSGMLIAGDGSDWQSKMQPIVPRGYVCHRASTPIAIDGKLDEPAWRSAAWTDDFGDIEGAAKHKPRFRTRAKLL